MRPADLLECVRQMSMEDRVELQRLLSEAFPPIIRMRDDVTDEENSRIAELVKKEFDRSRNTVTYESPVTFDHFIKSKKECSNCNTLMMQCESHYRCWHCGNVEHDND